MFKAFSLGFNPSEEETKPPATEMQQRLLLVIDKFSSEIPPIVRPMLSAHLHTLQDKMTDETILSFVQKGRELLHFIETGEVGVADDDSDQAE